MNQTENAVPIDSPANDPAAPAGQPPAAGDKLRPAGPDVGKSVEGGGLLPAGTDPEAARTLEKRIDDSIGSAGGGPAA